MKIPGYIVTDLFLVTILTTFMVLCITLPISRTNDSTLGESIFGKNESLDLKIKLSSGEELHLKAPGATTMDLVQSLKMILRNMEVVPLEGQYSVYTPPQVR